MPDQPQSDDEGRAALEAATEAVCRILDEDDPGERRIALAAIRAYLAALADDDTPDCWRERRQLAIRVRELQEAVDHMGISVGTTADAEVVARALAEPSAQDEPPEDVSPPKLPPGSEGG